MVSIYFLKDRISIQKYVLLFIQLISQVLWPISDQQISP